VVIGTDILSCVCGGVANGIMALHKFRIIIMVFTAGVTLMIVGLSCFQSGDCDFLNI